MVDSLMDGAPRRVAAPDPMWLERPVAVVAADPALTPDELTDFLREKFPRFWLSDRFVFVDEVPKMGGRQIRQETAAPTVRHDRIAGQVDGIP